MALLRVGGFLIFFFYSASRIHRLTFLGYKEAIILLCELQIQMKGPILYKMHVFQQYLHAAMGRRRQGFMGVPSVFPLTWRSVNGCSHQPF